MKSIFFALTVLLLSAHVSLAKTYNYISAEQMKNNMDKGVEMIILDIQVKDEFDKHHIPGSLATYAYPVKTDQERIALGKAITIYNETGKQLVIVCPRGKGGAKRSYDYMLSQNVPKEKLSILENGMAGWPFQKMVEGK